MPVTSGDSKTLALTANTVTTVTLDADYQRLEVVNLDGSAEVYFTVNGADPTVGGNATVALPAAISGVDIDPTGSEHTTVKLISSGTPKVHVRGW